MKNTIIKALLVSAVALGAISITSVSVSADSHTVQFGDTVWGIAQNNNTTIEEIESLNHFTDVNKIFVGDVIELPGVNTPAQVQPVAQVSAPEPVASTPSVEVSPVAVETPAVDSYVEPVAESVAPTTAPAVSGGSVYDQFIANGGTQAMWDTIVMPESGGNPNAVSPNGYMGLGQTKNSWGTGDVATQTQGMVNYAVERYGSIDNAIAWRSSNNWW